VEILWLPLDPAQMVDLQRVQAMQKDQQLNNLKKHLKGEHNGLCWIRFFFQRMSDELELN